MRLRRHPVRGRLWRILLAIAVLTLPISPLFQILTASAYNASISTTDGTIGDWSNIATCFPDATGDSGSAASDIIDMCVSNNGTYLYALIEVIPPSGATTIKGEAYDVAVSNGTSTAYGTMAWNSQGVLSVSAKNSAGTTTTEPTTNAQQVNLGTSGGSNTVVAVEAQFPLVDLGLSSGTTNYQVYGEVHASGSLSGTVKDRAPDGSAYLVYNATNATMSAGPGLCLATASAAPYSTYVAPSAQFGFTVTFVNGGEGTETLSSLSEVLPSGFSAVAGTSRWNGTLLTDPSSLTSPAWTSSETIAAGATAELTFAMTAPSSASSTNYYFVTNFTATGASPCTNTSSISQTTGNAGLVIVSTASPTPTVTPTIASTATPGQTPAAPVTIGSSGGSVSLSNDITTCTLTVPSGAVSTGTVFALGSTALFPNQTVTKSNASPADTTFGLFDNQALTITATQGGSAVTSFAAALTLVCGYDPSTVGSVDPETLQMNFYDSGSGTRTPLANNAVDTVDDTITATLTQLTTNNVELQGTTKVSASGGNAGAIFVQASQIEAPVNQPHPGCQFYLYG